MHFNLHKTFSTPHGGGGPGAGPIAVAEHLLPFLPEPLVAGRRRWLPPGARTGERPDSIGRVRAYARQHRCPRARLSPTSVLMAAAALRQVSEDAVLAANYLRTAGRGAYVLPYEGPCKHEFVATAQAIKEATGVRTLDIAKRLIDHGYHPPTIYFPLIVEECLLIEPTETESLETLDAFADALIAVAAEAACRPRAAARARHMTRRCDDWMRPPRRASRTCAGNP